MSDGTASEGEMTPTREAQDIVRQFGALRRHLLRTNRANFVRSGLTAPQLSVISLLANRGPMTLTELSDQLQLSHSTASGIVDRLQARGVVQRAPSPQDRRYTNISLTEEALRAGARIRNEGTMARLVQALAAATPEERRTISEGLALLSRFFDGLE